MKPLAILRPTHWIKNLIVFAPLFFSGTLYDPIRIWSTCVAFVAFCLVASGGYAWNDILDHAEDAKDERKKTRPLPSRTISVMRAGIIGFSATGGGLALAAAYAPASLGSIGIYVIASIFYSTYIKRIAVLELLFFPVFYLARIFAGGAAARTMPSHWLLLCVIFISLFIAVLKRRTEAGETRYPKTFLNGMTSIFGATTLMSYGLYSILGAQSPYAIYSLFFPIAGIMRYFFLTEADTAGEFPERTITHDPFMATIIICWIAFMYAIIY